MSEIPSDWSPDALLSFVGVFTALSAAASIFLAEIWSQKMRRRREHFKICQDRRLKIWQEQQRESFLRLERTAKKAQSEVNQVSDDNNEGYSQKVGQKEVAASGKPLVRFQPIQTERPPVSAMF